jgi:hypothetical protein
MGVAIAGGSKFGRGAEVAPPGRGRGRNLSGSGQPTDAMAQAERHSANKPSVVSASKVREPAINKMAKNYCWCYSERVRA